VAVVGLGLVGGSLARALTRAGYRVVGVDRLAVRRKARASGAIAETAASPQAAAARASAVVLAAHPVTNIRLLRQLAVVARPGLVITDVGSVKTPICREADRLGLAGFVGGHPMAGNEGSGFGASSPDLFRGRPWILTTHRSAAARTVRSLVRAVGARPLTLAPDVHDRVAAFLSHAPQLVAWAILDMAQHDPLTKRHLGLAGPGFRDMTRLAASPRPLWREILRQNRAQVRRAMRDLLERLRRSLP
jgi:prephenate dehydrogenase